MRQGWTSTGTKTLDTGLSRVLVAFTITFTRREVTVCASSGSTPHMSFATGWGSVPTLDVAFCCHSRDESLSVGSFGTVFPLLYVHRGDDMCIDMWPFV